jgi:hypothetical protein
MSLNVAKSVDPGGEEAVRVARDLGERGPPGVEEPDGVLRVGFILGDLPAQRVLVCRSRVVEEQRDVVRSIASPDDRGRARPPVGLRVPACDQLVPRGLPRLLPGPDLLAHPGEVSLCVEQPGMGHRGLGHRCPGKKPWLEGGGTRRDEKCLEHRSSGDKSIDRAQEPGGVESDSGVARLPGHCGLRRLEGNGKPRRTGELAGDIATVQIVSANKSLRQ